MNSTDSNEYGSISKSTDTSDPQFVQQVYAIGSMPPDPKKEAGTWCTARRKKIVCIVSSVCVLIAAAIIIAVLCSIYAPITTIKSNCEKACGTSGTCVLSTQWCDGVSNCPNGEDEAVCSAEIRACQMSCGSSGTCVLYSQWCNGISECPSGEDEQNCVRLYGPSFQLQAYSPANATWLPVCYDKWSDIVGKTTCQDIGYNVSTYYMSSQLLTSSNGYLMLQSNNVTGKLYRNLNYSATCPSGNTVSLRCINCGLSTKVDTRIVGGTVALAGDWPWQISLLKKVGTSTYLCGGSIITPYWIVTAAHCVYGSTSTPSAFKVFAGTLSLQSFSSAGYLVGKVLVHPNYASTTQNYDVALLKLTSALVFTNNLRPVCLPSVGMSWAEGQKCWISGWGTTSDGGSISYSLMAASVPLISSTTCNQAAVYSGAITSTMICAGYLSGGTDTCQGDSGGPLVTKNNSLWWLVGDTSWGYGCAKANKPGVYGNVTVFLEWIYSQMQIYG